MEILKSGEVLLSNYEVLEILKQVKKNNRNSKILATIAYETRRYLEETPANRETNASVQTLLQKLKEFRLTKAEKLSILNNRPSNLIELEILIEENEERFSTETMNQLLEIIQMSQDDEDSHPESVNPSDTKSRDQENNQHS